VSDFYLDKYEITVGRFRAFVNAGKGTQISPPTMNAGAHPLVAGTGWDSAWNTNLSTDTAALKTSLNCSALYQTWTGAPGSNENRPQNCLSWIEAFAFCAWDGGRLPTAAEWNYAAAGGNEQRKYPWSIPPTSTTIDDGYAVYCGGSCTSTQNVGMKPAGNGRWGHADLAGNVNELVFDATSTSASYPTTCNNCAYVISGVPFLQLTRDTQGGFFSCGASGLLTSSFRNAAGPTGRSVVLGARCARGTI
jgi:formylglycine-generating enzyme required for sulfatase activity